MGLTKAFLENIPPHTIFASGLVRDTEEVNVTGIRQLLTWVAVRGEIPDWAVYVSKGSVAMSDVTHYGDKVLARTARILVPCDDEMINLYRN